MNPHSLKAEFALQDFWYVETERASSPASPGGTVRKVWSSFPANLVNQLVRMERPDLLGPYAGEHPLKKAALCKGDLAKLILRVTVNEKFNRSAVMMYEVLDIVKTFKYEEIPEEMKQALEKQKADLIARLEKWKAEGGTLGGAKKQPPPNAGEDSR